MTPRHRLAPISDRPARFSPDVSKRASQSFARKALDGPLPADIVTASGSGLDPHISPAAAELQVPRVAAARNLPKTVCANW